MVATKYPVLSKAVSYGRLTANVHCLVSSAAKVDPKVLGVRLWGKEMKEKNQLFSNLPVVVYRWPLKLTHILA